MASNIIYVFAKSPPSPYSYTAEIRSAVETGSRHASTLYIKMLAKASSRANSEVSIYSLINLRYLYFIKFYNILIYKF